MLNKPSIPYQSNEKAFFIRKIRKNFDAISIDESPHRHEFQEFMYIESGSGKHEIDGVEYDLNKHSFYIISKGQIHNFLYAKDLEGTLIRFHDTILPSVQSKNEGYYHNLLFMLSNHNELLVKMEDRVLIELLLSRMLTEYEAQSPKTLDLSLIQHLLYPIIILMNRYVERAIDIRDYRQDQYAQFIHVLERYYKQQHGLNFYAQELGLSKRGLSKICQEKTGKAAKQIINERVLTEAKRFLQYTSLPLKEIADQLGFKDIGYFCRYFKKATSYTPSVYKNK